MPYKNTYYRGVVPYLRKSGGDLLFGDPTNNLEAATKQYVDAVSNTIALWGIPVISQRSFGPTFANGSGGFACAVGDAYAALLYVGRTGVSFDLVNAHVIAGTRVRAGVYSVTTSTLLPSALLVDAGTVTAGGVDTTLNVSVTISNTTPWVALAFLRETGAGSQTGDLSSLSNQAWSPLGRVTIPDPLGTAYALGWKLTGQTAGQLPAISAWTAATPSQFGGGVSIRTL